MFARRKPKPRDDEEPLVPHGMVWQATEDEAMPADNLDSREAAAPQPPAVPIPIDAVKAERKPETSAEHDSKPRSLGAISPPIAWPSAGIQKIVRPRPAEPENDARPISEKPAEKIPNEKKTAPRESDTRPQQEPSTPKVSDQSSELARKKPQSETLGSRVGRTSRRFSLATSDLAKSLAGRIREVSSSTANRFRRNPESAENHRSSSRLKQILDQTAGFAAANLREIRPEMRRMAADAKSRVDNWRQSVARTLPQRSQDSTGTQTVSTSDQASTFTRLSTVLRSGWNRKYRVRIPAFRSPFWRAHLASANRQWVLARASVRRNERILMPMVMAGVSALLAIALISGLRRYAPPQVSASHSTTSQPQAVPEVKPAGLLVPAAEASTPQIKPSATQSSEKPKAKKARHGGDDYVAKNTYVYYGNSGKPSPSVPRKK